MRSSLLSILVFLVVAVPANAAPDIAPWLGAAQSYWQATPNCPGGVAGVQLVAGNTQGGLMAADSPGCTIYYNPQNMPLRPWSWCVVIVHEYGHLLGYGHTAVQTDVMYAGGPWWATVPQCPAPVLPKAIFVRKTVTRCVRRKAWGQCARRGRVVIAYTYWSWPAATQSATQRP